MRKIIQIAWRPPFVSGYDQRTDPWMYALCDDGVVLEYVPTDGWCVFSYTEDIPQDSDDKSDLS